MNLRPIIELISVKIKNILQKPAGSLRKNIPIIAMPTAPMPVHIAYAVPRGIVSMALLRKI